MTDSEEHDDKDIKRVHVKAAERGEDRHKKTLKGTAEDAGVLKTNAEQGESINSDAREEKGKKDEKEIGRILAKQALDDFLKGVQERIAEIDRTIKAVNKLKELYKKGELDFDDPAHIVLMQEAGISQHAIENYGEDAFDERKEELKEEKQKLEEAQKWGQDVKEAYDQDPDNPEVQKQIIEGTEDLNQLWNLSGIGADELNKTTDKDFADIAPSFGDTDSYANKLNPEGGIQTVSASEHFAKVAPVQDFQVEQKPEPGAGFKISPDS